MTQWSSLPSSEGPDEQLFDVLADLEARAAALHDRERRAEVEDRARSAYAEVELAGRLMASIGRDLTVVLRGAGRVAGTLERVGTGWLRLAAPSRTQHLRQAAMLSVRGVSSRSVPPEAWGPLDRLQWGSVLRGISDEASPVQLHLVDGSRREGVLSRVGADFVEVVSVPGHAGSDEVVDLVVLEALAMVTSYD